MKAAVIQEYGGPETLTVKEVPKPQIGPNDVLVKVKATSINPVDWKIREGYLREMIPYEFPLILGWDAAGVIAEVGEQVKGWQVGDEVFTRPEITRNGTYAEYVAVPSHLIAPKPKNLSYEEAASIPLVGLTTWECLVDNANIKPGQRILILGGSGGVGTFAIQFAKAKGLEVVTTCSSKNVEFVQQLGADEVIDYTKDDMTAIAPVDVVYDTVGGETLTQAHNLVKRGGFLVSIAGQPDQEVAKQKGFKATYVFLNPDGEKLAKIGIMLEDEAIKPIVAHTFGLDQIREAHEQSETGRTRGKIVITV
ncbi:NADP-dependent oxidoreductase [Bacillus fonticola]|uniref:NADP-dependent oxidoreductase n=1 Tax=Bacillus fonticola TaxID=2728853 RepID=UPI001474309C|nr:NADP-dependent oxidoreductase [Bacillus fonticola]